VSASQRCQITPSYIQAVTTGRTRFLVTNLTEPAISDMTPIASSWLLGRSSACAIPIAHRSVSRCHAVIGHHSTLGFYITDIGSSNGTWVNYHSLARTERRFLKDGDLLQLGKLQIEFFLSSFSPTSQGTGKPKDETTYG
jgi:pSer/pThr/pTyr-binding forkhead associated (FHA) protein